MSKCELCGFPAESGIGCTNETCEDHEVPDIAAALRARLTDTERQLREERCERLEEVLVRAEKFRLAIRERLMWQDSAAATDDWQERYREGFDAKTPPFVITPGPDEMTQAMQEGKL